MKKSFLLIMTFIAVALTANAQSYIEHIQVNEEGKGRITVNIPDSLIDIINGIAKAEAIPDSLAEIGTHTGGGAVAAGPSLRKQNGVTHVYKAGETVSVYSIQVYSGSNSRESHEKAVSIARQANAKFPGSGARATFHSPRWIVIMGAYATQEAAQAMVKRMHGAGFSQASIFRRNVVKK